METIISAPKKRASWTDLIVFSTRTLLGMSLGVIFSVVGQEVIGYGKISTIFVVISFVAITLRLTKGWNVTKILILTINVVLFFIFIKTYISVAPGE